MYPYPINGMPAGSVSGKERYSEDCAVSPGPPYTTMNQIMENLSQKEQQTIELASDLERLVLTYTGIQPADEKQGTLPGPNTILDEANLKLARINTNLSRIASAIYHLNNALH